MNYQELKNESEKLQLERNTLEKRIEDLNEQLKILPEYTFNFVGDKNINKENTPYIYELLSSITMIEDDNRNLDWGRGKNVVDYYGISFIYKDIKYTTGKASSWCTSEYFFAKYDDADRTYYEGITDEIIEDLDEIYNNSKNYKAFDEYIKNLNYDEEELDVVFKVSLVLFITQNLMQY